MITPQNLTVAAWFGIGAGVLILLALGFAALRSRIRHEWAWFRRRTRYRPARPTRRYTIDNGE